MSVELSEAPSVAEQVSNLCLYCATPCDPANPEVHHQVTLWIGGEKKNLSTDRVYTGRVACPSCVADMKAGQPPGQGTLFDESAEKVDVKEYNLGFSAGWRGDELVTPKSRDYRLGYESGTTGRESVGG